MSAQDTQDEMMEVLHRLTDLTERMATIWAKELGSDRQHIQQAAQHLQQAVANRTQSRRIFRICPECIERQRATRKRVSTFLCHRCRAGCCTHRCMTANNDTRLCNVCAMRDLDERAVEDLSSSIHDDP